MTKRLAAVAVTGLLAVAAVPGSAGAVECAPKPSDPVGYELRATHADQVQVPPTTPPIAVLDSGVSPVPELEGRLRQGVDAATGGRNTNDTDGHGTAVASIAAAQAGGVRGISPSTPIIPIRIFDARGDSTAEVVVSAVDRAIALGAGVINISASQPPGSGDPAADRIVQAAIERAVTKGIVVVVPSGNEGKSTLNVPASYPHVIAVGATDESGDQASFSNGGPGLDLVAPGANLTTAAPGFLCASGYQFASGTSFSAPAVAGAAALLEARHPGLDSTQLTDMLRLHGPRVPAPAWRPGLGFGMLDVAAVLAAPVPAPDAPEVDDTITWAKRHSPVLTTRKRKSTINARVAMHTDPADTFRVRLKRGDLFRATLEAKEGTLTLSLRTEKRKLATARALRVRIKRSGTYYVTVAVKQTPPEGADYSLRLRR